MRWTAVVWIALVGCRADQVLVSSDVRVDQADPGSDPESEHARLCAAPSGDLFAVWADARSGQSAIWLNESTDGGVTWRDQPILLNQGAGAAYNPEIACTADRVYVAWEDTRDGALDNRNIYVAVGRRGSAGNLRFGDEDFQLDDDPDGDHNSLRPQIAARADSVWVVWSDQRNGAYDIFVATSPDQGETFYEARRLDSDEAGAAYSAQPRIAAAQDLVVVAWEDSRDGLSDIYAATSTNGGLTFEPDFRVDTGEAAGLSDSFAPSVAVDGSGTAYIAWQDTRNGPQRDVYVNWTSNGGVSWAGEPVRVDADNPGFYDSIYPKVAVACGVGHVTWQDDRNGGYDIYYRRAIGGSFADEVRLNGGGAGEANSFEPVLVSEGDCGTATDASLVVGWRDLRNDDLALGYNDLYYSASTDNGLNFDILDLRLDSLEGGTSYKVDLSLGLRDGALSALWVDGRSGTADVYFHGMALGEEASLIPVDADEIDAATDGSE